MWPELIPALCLRVDSCTQVTHLNFVAWEAGQRVESEGQGQKGHGQVLWRLFCCELVLFDDNAVGEVLGM